MKWVLKTSQGGNQVYTLRDVFGFERPGEARTHFLFSSIDKDNVFRSQRGTK